MKAFAAIYKGNWLLELCDDVSLAEDSEVLVVVPEGQCWLWSSFRRVHRSRLHL